jgi:hypothetical protein
MATFKCISKQKPFFNNRQWEFGETFEGEKANKHFEEIEVSKEEVETSSLLQRVKTILMGMDHEDDSLWTARNTPKLAVVEKILGVVISKKVIDEAYPGFVRDVKPLSKQKAMKT